MRYVKKKDRDYVGRSDIEIKIILKILDIYYVNIKKRGKVVNGIVNWDFFCVNIICNFEIINIIVGWFELK